SYPYYFSTETNSYYRYDEQGEKMSGKLNLDESEIKELYKIMEEIWHYFPTSFENEKMMDEDQYNLKVDMNGQTKRITWTSSDAGNDEIASILTKRVYAAIEIIEKR
ncbi:MAG: hypothetical protein PF505_11070, partial [Vallitaleaceae bacterium]|nr:hypothetical protein [Vallitaleaceae bacterium]